MADNLFDRIGQLAETKGTPDRGDLSDLAEEYLVGKSSLFGTVTFYDYLKPENQGKIAYVCNGTACECAGTQETVRKILYKKLGSDRVGHMTCLGRCHENAAFQFKGKNFSGQSIHDIEGIMSDGLPVAREEYTVKATGRPVLTLPFPGVNAFFKPLEKIFSAEPVQALREIKASGLRGRGGAGFPLGTKLEACRQAAGSEKFIICNADEGDPGAYSDRYLLENQPHAVLFGMLVAGYITGAGHGIIYIRAEYPEAVQIIRETVQVLQQQGYLGEGILGSGFSFNVSIVEAKGSYICGEETALINSIEGQRPEVRIRPPYPVQEGLFNRPTVVSNVETLSAIHFMMEFGGITWQSIGTVKSSGTKLLSLDGFFNKPGIYEVEMGTSLAELVYQHAGGFRTRVKALQIGGPLGGLVPISELDKLTIDFESFANNGFLLGHASVVSIPEDYPIIVFLKHLFEFAAYESCGKCFPCRLGTQRGKELLEKGLTGNYQINGTLFLDLLETLEKGSLCAHGSGLPLPVRNAITYFREELDPYFTKLKES